METSLDRTFSSDDAPRAFDTADGEYVTDVSRVLWGADPYAEAELRSRTERTRAMIEKARHQLV